ncbi:hypothetical protein AVEN_42874-1 [Araneus ventricosus]|uniref:Uncharacterized protein n=1 Tax=Araneus ventricosus TaxID=182803 RepID=A0A4Y2AFF3_ARAVE|nr:hypothetical protein AVEN_42874-1 [Araneus ventricosus]
MRGQVIPSKLSPELEARCHSPIPARGVRFRPHASEQNLGDLLLKQNKCQKVYERSWDSFQKGFNSCSSGKRRVQLVNSIILSTAHLTEGESGAQCHHYGEHVKQPGGESSSADPSDLLAPR